MTLRILLSMAAVFSLLSACDSEPAQTRQSAKEKHIAAIRQTLLSSVEAEKSAVLATTDAESQAFADESRKQAREIQAQMEELRRQIDEDGRPVELTAMQEVDRTWTELKSIDERLLPLAVANSNLKASRLAAAEGAATVDRLVALLTAAQAEVTDPDSLRALAQASIAALKIQALLAIHIPSSDDGEMSRLEQQIGELQGQVDRALAKVASLPELAGAPQLWSEDRRLTAEILRLSRQNTNVISFDVSVHEKRHATRDCLAALDKLQAAVESAPQATR